MIITLSDKLRICGTETCWQLERLKQRKGKPKWKPYKYFATVDSALHEAAQRELRVYPTQTLTVAFDAVSRVTQKYAQIFDDVGKRHLRVAS